jgi:hypothetical protein
MKRSALIIGAPDNSIKGVYDDMKNYRAFMKSFAGGAWYDHEIVTLESPSKYEVETQINLLEKSDYSLVVFAGHGEYSRSYQATMLYINAQTKIEEHVLKVGAPRRTLVIDACRVIAKETLVEGMVRKASIALDHYQDLSASRALFERSVMACHPGLAVLYSCNIGEGAGDMPGTGGRYSSAILQVSGEWAESRSTPRASALSVSDAHDLANPLVVKRSGGSQNPRTDLPRNVPRFPFAVKA